MRDRLAAETKAALKARDKPRLSALRLISAALQQSDIAAKAPIPDRDIPALLQKMIKQLSEAQAREAIAAAIKELGAASPKEMGKVMAALKERYAGRMDFAKASGLVKELLK